MRNILNWKAIYQGWFVLFLVFKFFMGSAFYTNFIAPNVKEKSPRFLGFAYGGSYRVAITYRRGVYTPSKRRIGIGSHRKCREGLWKNCRTWWIWAWKCRCRRNWSQPWSKEKSREGTCQKRSDLLRRWITR